VRTVNFKSFFETMYLPSIGKDPLDFVVGTAAGNRQVGYVNDALVEAGHYAFWPELLVIEERTLNDDNVLPWSATGKTDIDAIEGIFATEAEAIARKGHLWFEQGPAGYRVFDRSGTVWARLRPYPPVFSRTAYAAGTTYSVDDLCYTATLGKSWISVDDDNTGNDPESDDGSYWEEVVLPAEFVPYLKARAGSAHLFDERKFDAAGLKESKANTILFKLKKSKGL